MNSREKFMCDRSHGARTFILWAVICIAANIFCAFPNAFDGDQMCWQGWTRSLISDGFAGFSGNYPPVYVLWLWAVGKFYAFFGMEVYRNFLLKFLCLVPVYFAHVGLLQLAWSWMQNRKIGELHGHLILGIIALNPALLATGPVWGQVDLFPAFLAMLSLSCALRPQKIVWSFPLFILSLLTKFQMIAFLPVLGALWIRRAKIAWKGIPMAALWAFVVLLPFIVTGSLSQVMSSAYVKSASMYPYATFNAANLWMILAGNIHPDNVPLFGLSPEGLGRFVTINVIGKVLFVLFSLGIFIRSLGTRNPRKAFRFCALTGLAFFVLLPEMHERYIVCAVPPALLWLSRSRAGAFPWVLLFSCLVAGNVQMVHGFRGEGLWVPFSFAVCTAFLLFVLDGAFPGQKRKIVALLQKIPPWTGLPYVLLFIAVFGMVVYKAFIMSPVSAALSEKEVLVYDLEKVRSEQGYKSPATGKSVEGNPLTVGGKVYRDGIGAHAPSKLVYRLPKGADSLRFGYAVDDESSSGELRFIIRLDNQIAWTSGVVRSRDTPVFTGVSVRGAKTVTLELSPQGSDSGDHGDWLLPVVSTR